MLDTYLSIATSPLLWVFLAMCLAALGIMRMTALEVKPKRYETGWLRKNYVTLLIGAAAILATAAIYLYLFGIGQSLSALVFRLRLALAEPDTPAEDLRHLGTTVALLMGVLAAAATIFFSIIRVWINERTATATEEGLITDRISKAVEGLGAEKTVKRDGEESTTPNLEVRIGAIYALERIAQDSLRDHIQIMEILCAYIRENAPLRETPQSPFEEGQEASKSDIESSKLEMPDSFEMFSWTNSLPKPRTDIQATLEVIGRRSPRQINAERRTTIRGSTVGYRLDLRATCLQNTDLRELDFDHALLTETQLQGAVLDGANLQRADLGEAQLQEAFLNGAQLQEAFLNGAQLQDAVLDGAQLEGAFLNEAQLQGAFLDGARLQEADLGGAKLQGARLSQVQFDTTTSLNAANLQGAALSEVDLTNFALTQNQIEGMFGDATVTLPGGHGPDHENWPDHWSKEKLDIVDFFHQWRAFQASIGQDPEHPT